jgi:hypothetical protein
LLLEAGELYIHGCDEDALGLSVIDQGGERLIAGVSHDGNAIRLGGHGFGELRDHLLRVPIGPDVFHVGAGIGGSRQGAVVDYGLKTSAGRAAGEEHDLGARAPPAFGCRSSTFGCRGLGRGGRLRRRGLGRCRGRRGCAGRQNQGERSQQGNPGRQALKHLFLLFL